MSELSVAWAELMRELDQRAPASRADIRPGSPDGPALVERELGIVLPAELREWFTLHDGSGMRFDTELLPGTVIMGPLEAARDSRLTREIWAEFDAGELDSAEFTAADAVEAGTIAYTRPPEYVMVASDGCGGGLFVDTRAGPLQGCVRWWDKTDADNDYGNGPAAPSLAAMLDTVTASLRNATPALHDLVATVRDSRLDWTDAAPL